MKKSGGFNPPVMAGASSQRQLPHPRFASAGPGTSSRRNHLPGNYHLASTDLILFF